MQKVKLTKIHFDADTGRFEARVDITRETVVFRYPCVLIPDPDMTKDQIRLGLIAQALHMSDSQWSGGVPVSQ